MYAINMKNISKSFGKFKANDKINLKVKRNEIHAILGENGAGKTTLMNILFGIYQPDEGDILINDKKVYINNPKYSQKIGIGMVHQHFRLVDNFTVAENIVLGNEISNKYGILNKRDINQKILDLSSKYKLKIDPTSVVRDLSVAIKQRIEILKMLYRNNDILIFDEPTAILCPEEIKEFLSIIKKLKDEGKTIVLITHKLNEIKLIADTCTILRKGKFAKEINISSSTKEELASAMFGDDINFDLGKRLIVDEAGKDKVFSLKNIELKDNNKKKLDNICFDVHGGEILGICGVEGNGQNELFDVIVGKCKKFNGKIEFLNSDITKTSISQRNKKGISFIPEDRQNEGLILDFNIEENLILKDYRSNKISKRGILNTNFIKKNSNKLLKQYNVQANNESENIVRNLSGGNQQKIIISRELSREHKFLIAFQPTRGLDVIAIDFIHKKLIEERKKGTAILLISYELEEIINLSDRIAAMSNGKILDIIDANNTNISELGLLMAGYKKEKREA